MPSLTQCNLYAHRDDRPIQGTVDRCLTLVRAMNPDTTGDDRVDPADLMDAAVDVQDTPTSNPGMVRQEPRPGQTASRDRTQSGWDVLPFVPKCGMPCLTCGAPCNWGGTSSDWQMTILRTYVFIMIYMSYTVSQQRMVRGDLFPR